MLTGPRDPPGVLISDHEEEKGDVPFVGDVNSESDSDSSDDGCESKAIAGKRGTLLNPVLNQHLELFDRAIKNSSPLLCNEEEPNERIDGESHKKRKTVNLKPMDEDVLDDDL